MLDSESGSFYEIDELTRALIDLKNSPNEQSMGDFSSYSEDEIKAARSEIDDLIAERVLFCESEKAVDFSHQGIIKSMCLNISHSCNLKCEYCFADGGSYFGEQANMSLSVACSAIDFLIANSANRRNLEVDFFGGEPLLNLDVVKKTVEYARKKENAHGKKFRFTITTNALTLNDEITDFFNDEMDNVVISIDGRKDVHNTVRKTVGGQDSFDRVINNALAFAKKRADKQYYIRGTFTSLNKDFSKDVLFLNDCGFDRLSIEPVVLPNEHRLSIKEGDLDQIKTEYESLAREYITRRKGDKWFSFFHFNIDINNGPCEKKRLSSCGAGCEYVAVTPNGDIYPCHQFAGNVKYKMGNVLNSEFDKNLSQLFNKNCVLCKSSCQDCWAKYYCSGGCAANAVNFNGSILKPHLISCELMKKRTECALAIFAIENM